MALERRLGLVQATALNMIDMVGIGPFVTMSMVVEAMKGPQAIAAWIVGMLLAFTDASVWSELGAAMPRAGGSYVFLREAYGPGKWGRMMSFLFIWQTMIQAPLVVASGAIGFSEYFSYLWIRVAGSPLPDEGRHMIAAGLVVALLAVLYRGIGTLGKISVGLGICVIATILWIIWGGFTHFNAGLAFGYPEGGWDLSTSFFAGLGAGCLKTVYSYLGYYNVCHLGAEVRKPEKLIPRSMFISVAGIAVLYIAMNLSVYGVVPWQTLSQMSASNANYPVSIFMEMVYGPAAATVVTILILLVAVSSLFAVVLGYSRIPYAAALDGNFFRIFARVHPTKHFPTVSLVMICAIAFVFSFFGRLTVVIKAILAMRIVVQFIGQAVGIIVLRTRNPAVHLPFRMWLYPVPAVLAIVAWAALYYATGEFMYYALIAIGVGLVVFLIRTRLKREWPFGAPVVGAIEAGSGD
ncbi:MAG TPA: APC family permease [Candidatus Kapabacteria bacterium]|nr:APC family permease [Candidatus Kapabacteria bacterium]